MKKSKEYKFKAGDYVSLECDTNNDPFTVYGIYLGKSTTHDQGYILFDKFELKRQIDERGQTYGYHNRERNYEDAIRIRTFFKKFPLADKFNISDLHTLKFNLEEKLVLCSNLISREELLYQLGQEIK